MVCRAQKHQQEHSKGQERNGQSNKCHQILILKVWFQKNCKLDIFTLITPPDKTSYIHVTKEEC